jgi:hypothetical protein
VENPTLNSPNTVDCASCHVAQLARILVGQQQFGIDPTGNPNAFVPDAQAVPAADAQQTTSIDLNNGLDLHAFSYKNTEPMINQRVINETAALVAYLRSVADGG